MGNGEEAFKICLHECHKFGLADFDVHFVALEGTGHGEVGTAEEGDLVVDQDHFLVEDAVFADEEDPDAGLFQFAGEVIGGFADTGTGAGAEFAEDDHIEALTGFRA